MYGAGIIIGSNKLRPVAHDIYWTKKGLIYGYITMKWTLGSKRSVMTTKMDKFKPGDLVEHERVVYRKYYGIGIVVSVETKIPTIIANGGQFDFGPTYCVYWTKTGLKLHFGGYLCKVW